MTPSLEEIVATTKAHLNERQARQLVEERAAADRRKDLASVVLAELLGQTSQAIRAAAEFGHTSASVEYPLRAHDSPTHDQAEAIVRGATEALRAFEPEVSYVVPNDDFVNRLTMATPPEWIFAQAGIEYHRFRGFRVCLSWKLALEEALK